MSNKHKFEGSSSIDYCDYYDNTNTMEIKFSSGAVYHYPDCDKKHFEALKQAASPGKHFHSNIRSKKSIKVK